MKDCNLYQQVKACNISMETMVKYPIQLQAVVATTSLKIKLKITNPNRQQQRYKI